MQSQQEVGLLDVVKAHIFSFKRSFQNFFFIALYPPQQPVHPLELQGKQKYN
jgi:hypothetical protein